MYIRGILPGLKHQILHQWWDCEWEECWHGQNIFSISRSSQDLQERTGHCAWEKTFQVDFEGKCPFLIYVIFYCFRYGELTIKCTSDIYDIYFQSSKISFTGLGKVENRIRRENLKLNGSFHRFGRESHGETNYQFRWKQENLFNFIFHLNEKLFQGIKIESYQVSVFYCLASNFWH